MRKRHQNAEMYDNYQKKNDFHSFRLHEEKHKMWKKYSKLHIINNISSMKIRQIFLKERKNRIYNIPETITELFKEKQNLRVSNVHCKVSN